jgi:AcrR family transcriptional regulator
MTVRLRAKPNRRAATARDTYHHGNLRKALMAATLELLEEGGPDAVSVREAAKRAGVSAGAPFRHFPTRTALMTAVAEEATRRLRTEIAAAVAAVGNADPLARFRAFGTGYFRWVNRNKAMFLVVSTRSLIDYDGSPTIGPDNDALRTEMDSLINEAEEKGLLRRSAKDAPVTLAARAFVYGLARMLIDDHLRQWKKPNEKPEAAMNRALDLFIDSLRREKP